MYIPSKGCHVDSQRCIGSGLCSGIGSSSFTYGTLLAVSWLQKWESTNLKAITFLVKLDHFPQTSWVNKFTKSLLTLLATSFWRLWTLLLALSGYCASEHCGWETWQQIRNHCKHWQIQTFEAWVSTIICCRWHSGGSKFLSSELPWSTSWIMLNQQVGFWEVVKSHPKRLERRTSPTNPVLLSGWNSDVFGYIHFQDISLNNKDGTRGHAWVWWSLFFLSTACAVLQLLWQAGWFRAVDPLFLPPCWDTFF